MEFITNNWPAIFAGAVAVGIAAVFFYRFLGLTTEQQLAKVKEWLLWAVTEAEKDLGGGTGKLKLRQVYDLFVTRFPKLARVISFEKFSDLVDEVLEDMRDMIETNAAVKSHVEEG